MVTNTTVHRWLRPGDLGFDAQRSGFNIAVAHHPHIIVEADGPADVVAAVRLAADAGRPVAVMNTGHGPSVSADGAVLVRTAGMSRVDVDPVRRTARIEGGAAWRAVIEAATPYGLAPLNGSSPHVGAIGYTLGGGVGQLARRFGFAADHVHWLDVVTADGEHRQVSADADSDPELFWALRGAGANFGVVTAMEVDLFPVASLLGGELWFGAEASEEVLHTYADWARDMPETMASSLLLLGYPDDPAVPEDLRGRHITHVRIAYTGDDYARGGERWVEPLRRIDPLVLDTVRVMPYAEIGTIHHEPTDEPVPAFDRNVLLRAFDQDAATVLSKHAGPTAEAPFLVELRAWGGALSRPPTVANAVAGRDAAYSLLAISDPAIENRARRDELLAAMQPWATGTTCLNFNGVEDCSLEAVRRAYRPEDFARLQQIKAAYDPDNLFRINFNIPPKGPSEATAARPADTPAGRHLESNPHRDLSTLRITRNACPQSQAGTSGMEVE
jgi:FAD/FMN-containing dehydrogenase